VVSGETSTLLGGLVGGPTGDVVRSPAWRSVKLAPTVSATAAAVPATAVGVVLWALLYGVLGVLTGGLFESPVVAAAAAAVLVLVVGGVSALIGRWRARRSAPVAPAVGAPRT